jgi:SRSO17 transposase
MDFENTDAWSEAFEEFFSHFAHEYGRSEVRESAKKYMRGLLAEVKRKNSWQLAEKMEMADPHPLQRLLNEAKWDADVVCRQLRVVVTEQMGSDAGIGVIDESGFVKKGDKSAGVARQWCGRLGKVENCQVGVFLGYVTPTGAALIDRRLYLPEAWCEDDARCRAAQIPTDVTFQTKPEQAQAMLKQAWAEGVPMAWVTGDTVYGNSPELRNLIHREGRYYVMAISSQHHVIKAGQQATQALTTLLQGISATAWVEIICRLGEKGPISYQWAALRVQLPNDDVDEQWLLLRHAHEDAPITFYLSNAPADAALEDLVAVAQVRHVIELLIQEAKSEVGLADYEVRHWRAWYRHITLTMLAHTWLKLIQHHQREKNATFPHGSLSASPSSVAC